MKTIVKFLNEAKGAVSYVKPYFGFSDPHLSKTIAVIASFLTPVVEVVAVNIANEFVLKEADKNDDTPDFYNRMGMFM